MQEHSLVDNDPVASDLASDALIDTALNPPTVADGARPVGIIKSRPEHFQVFELPVIAPSGSGSHRWLELERVGMNTEYAVRQIARIAQVQKRDVGFAGLKDRHARTRQWFSVPDHAHGAALSEALQRSGLQVINSAMHERKLRRGALRGNRFRLFVRSDDEHNTADFESRGALVQASVQRICAIGVPNYFGPQRFGHAGNNVNHAQRMLCEGQRVRDRHLRGLYLSAARSALFNHVLAARVRERNWNVLLDGEVIALNGSASYFAAEPGDELLAARLDDFDIHPSGPLVGDGALEVTGQAAAVENEALQDFEGLMGGLRAARVEPARRALRVGVADLALESCEGEGWWLDFSLPSGAFATSVLREIFDLVDGSQRDFNRQPEAVAPFA